MHQLQKQLKLKHTFNFLQSF